MTHKINEKLQEAVLDVLTSRSFLYEKESGEQIQAIRPADINIELRDRGWKGVSRLDDSDYRELGFDIKTARYVGGARKKQFCTVVTL